MRPKFDAILPINYAIGLGVYEGFGTRGGPGLISTSVGLGRRREALGAAPMRQFKQRSEKIVRALNWIFYGCAQQYHPLNQIGTTRLGKRQASSRA